MKIEANTPDEYLEQVEELKRLPLIKLRELINTSLPSGFQETMTYGMIGWVVPHSLYAPGYHCDPKLPLPFLSIAAQKNFIGFYHMGIYADTHLYEWFNEEYLKTIGKKADMGKSCLRLKKPEHIPYDLIGELCQKINPQEWIAIYEREIRKG